MYVLSRGLRNKLESQSYVGELRRVFRSVEQLRIEFCRSPQELACSSWKRLESPWKPWLLKLSIEYKPQNHTQKTSCRHAVTTIIIIIVLFTSNILFC